LAAENKDQPLTKTNIQAPTTKTLHRRGHLKFTFMSRPWNCRLHFSASFTNGMCKPTLRKFHR